MTVATIIKESLSTLSGQWGETPGLVNTMWLCWWICQSLEIIVVSGDISWDDPPPPRPRAWQQFWSRPIQACQAHPGPSRHVRPEQFWLQARLGFMWENASSSIDCCHHWSFNSCLLLRNHPLTLRVLTGSGQWEKLITALLRFYQHPLDSAACW